MQTLFLLPASWDLALDSSANIAVASDPYAQAQDAASALRTFAGEVFYDTTQGVPYWEQILGHNPPLALMKAAFVNAALTVPGVVAAKVFLTSAGRTISGQVQITNTTGIVSAAGF